MSFYREFQDLRTSKEEELRATMAAHRMNLESFENELKKDMADYERQIGQVMKQYTGERKKLENEKRKNGANLKWLELEQAKEIEAANKEIRHLEKKYELEITKRMRELEVAQNELKAERVHVAEAANEEQTACRLNTQIIGITKLWMEVDDEKDNIMSLKEMGSVEMMDIWKKVLKDMNERKEEMNESVDSLKKCNDLVKLAGGPELLGILPEVGKPLESLKVLIREAETGTIGDIEKLIEEVNEVAKWVLKLSHVAVAPKRTVLMVLEQKRKAIK